MYGFATYEVRVALALPLLWLWTHDILDGERSRATTLSCISTGTGFLVTSFSYYISHGFSFYLFSVWPNVDLRRGVNHTTKSSLRQLFGLRILNNVLAAESYKRKSPRDDDLLILRGCENSYIYLRKSKSRVARRQQPELVLIFEKEKVLGRHGGVKWLSAGYHTPLYRAWHHLTGGLNAQTVVTVTTTP